MHPLSMYPIPAAVSPRLRGHAAVARHLDAPGRAPRLRALLDAFGVDADAVAALGSPEHPRLLFAEQAGCWLAVAEQARVAFIRQLAAALGHPDGWCVRSLGADGLTGGGSKGVFLSLWLHPGFGQVRLMPPAVLERHHRRAYRALPIEPALRARLEQTFAGLDAIGEALVGEPRVFAAAMRAALLDGARPGLRALLPRDHGADALRALGEALSSCDGAAVRGLAQGARGHVERAATWTAAWDPISADFLRAPVAPLDPLFDAFVLCIADPGRAARAIAEATGAALDEGVPLVGVIAPDGVYRIVRWSPGGAWWQQGATRHPIAWSTVRALAERGETGGPVGLLEYLLLAATGHYLIVDDDDPAQGFDLVADAVYRRYVGVGFPAVAFCMSRGARDAHAAGEWLLDAYAADAPSRIERAVACSMEP